MKKIIPLNILKKEKSFHSLSILSVRVFWVGQFCKSLRHNSHGLKSCCSLCARTLTNQLQWDCLKCSHLTRWSCEPLSPTILIVSCEDPPFCPLNRMRALSVPNSFKERQHYFLIIIFWISSWYKNSDNQVLCNNTQW